MSTPFVPPSQSAVTDLIAEYPLAWVLSTGSGPFGGTPLPLLADTDEAGNIIRLVGHCARRNPQVPLLEADPNVHILFQGPQGYLSPTFQDNPQWGPTWNYAVVKIEAKLYFRPDQNDIALERLVNAMESTRGGGWTIADLGERYEVLKKAIVAFHAEVTSVNSVFKMGQDEKPDTLAQLIKGLGDDPLAEWMVRCNKDRLSGGNS